MNRFHTIGRLGVIAAGLVGALLAWCAGALPAALAAVELPLGGDPRGRPGLPGPPGWNKHPPLPAPAHTLVTAGMPGGEVTLIAVGAVLLTAALAVIACRAWAARRREPTVIW